MFEVTGLSHSPGQRMVSYETLLWAKQSTPNPEEWGHSSWHLSSHTISQPIFSQEDESCSFLGVRDFLTRVPSHFLQESSPSWSWKGEGTMEATSELVHGTQEGTHTQQTAPSQGQERNHSCGEVEMPGLLSEWDTAQGHSRYRFYVSWRQLSLLSFSKYLSRDMNLSCPKR